jgi:hypothetical protein
MTTIRRVSLNVSDPNSPSNAAASRLPAIEVYKD